MTYDMNAVRPKVGDPFDYNLLNKFKQNMDALENGNFVYYEHGGSSPTTWTGGTLTEFNDVASVWNLTITTVGRPVLAGFSGSVQRVTDLDVAFDIIHYYGTGANAEIDPLDVAAFYGMAAPIHAGQGYYPFGFVKPYPYLGAGTHEFHLVWALFGGSGANVATLDGITKPSMFVYEGL